MRTKAIKAIQLVCALSAGLVMTLTYAEADDDYLELMSELLQASIDQDWQDGFADALEYAGEDDTMLDVLAATVALHGVPQAVIDLEALWPDGSIDIEAAWLAGDFDLDGLWGEDDLCEEIGVPGLDCTDNPPVTGTPGAMLMVPECSIHIPFHVPCIPTGNVNDELEQLIRDQIDALGQFIIDNPGPVMATVCGAILATGVFIITKSPKLAKVAQTAGIGCGVVVAWVTNPPSSGDDSSDSD